MGFPTQDPHVLIEEQRTGYVRYRRDDGYRWEAYGECIGLAHCIVGAVIDGVEVQTLKEATEIWGTRDFGADCPILPGFDGCCPFTFAVLNGD
jgi:hypothetical protein